MKLSAACSCVDLPLSAAPAVPPKEIHRIRRKYKALVKGEDMTKDEFYSLPAVSVNPLRDQLFKSLELSPAQTITFAVRSKDPKNIWNRN